MKTQMETEIEIESTDLITWLWEVLTVIWGS